MLTNVHTQGRDGTELIYQGHHSILKYTHAIPVDSKYSPCLIFPFVPPISYLQKQKQCPVVYYGNTGLEETIIYYLVQWYSTFWCHGPDRWYGAVQWAQSVSVCQEWTLHCFLQHHNASRIGSCTAGLGPIPPPSILHHQIRVLGHIHSALYCMIRPHTNSSRSLI